MARLQRKEAVLDTERGQAEQERGAAAVRLAEIEQALGTAERDRDEGSRRLAALTTAVADARAASEAAQVRTSEAKSVLAALRERAAATEAECRRLEQDHRDLLGRIAAAEQRGAEMEARREELRAEMAEAERLLTEALGARDRVSGEAAVAEDRVRDVRNELEGREAALKERRRERDMLRDALSELEVSQARTGSDLDHLGRECHQAVAMMAAEAAALITDEDRAQDLSGLEVQVQEMRERLDRMGPVNVLAVEQSQELEERSTFLTAQRQDLLDSIAELDQAIRKIDRASRERFQEAFQVINQHFGEIFRQLFGGGTAGLALIDEEDLLESGIDVMAQPPGKRLQNVMLLSGGREGADRDLAPVRDLPVQALALLHPRRGGRAPRRREHRPLRAHAGGAEGADAVRAHHPLAQDDGDRGPALRRHHGRAGGQQAGERPAELAANPRSAKEAAARAEHLLCRVVEDSFRDDAFSDMKCAAERGRDCSR